MDDADLAGLLQVPVPMLHRLLGRGWQRRDDVVDLRPERQWFGTGEPVQVLIGADGRDLVLARPRGHWDGPVRLRYEPVDDRPFAGEDLRLRPAALSAAARDIATRRRQSFRWCPTCRLLLPPEHFERSAPRCTACQEIVDGVAS
ncbi:MULTISPECIES: hypothetical protein [unclassified Blastococcus]